MVSFVTVQIASSVALLHSTCPSQTRDTSMHSSVTSQKKSPGLQNGRRVSETQGWKKERGGDRTEARKGCVSCVKYLSMF